MVIYNSKEFTPIGSAAASNDSIFLDSADDLIKFKSSTGKYKTLSDDVPIGTIVGWARDLNADDALIDTNTYGTLVESEYIAVSWTGQDLINVGFTPGEVFSIKFDVSYVRTAGAGDPSNQINFYHHSAFQISGATQLYHYHYDDYGSNQGPDTQYLGVNVDWTASTFFFFTLDGDADGSNQGYTKVANINFYKSAVSLPSHWVLCDGDTINDADSPLNGVAVPDLHTTARFLRGNSTSGGTGGSETHTHNVTTQEGADPGETALTSIDTAYNLPPYYTVAWIIKIKHKK